MSAPDMDKVFELFARAIEVETAEQPALLHRECTDDADLRREVESLLLARRGMGAFMRSSPVSEPRFGAGDRIGGYEIVREIAAGGSGRVYEAWQAQPRRRVALKILRAQGAGHRFREEAEMLARLQHPGIAHVYEAGVHEGLPYLALEFVERARSITDFAERLDPRARLELFARTCDAVHHGHQKGVIHCDLKPGNVLVDESGAPKVIDFGIAHRLGEGGPRARIGTPPFMSPEQADLDDEPPDVRSDVYALGVLLGELIANPPADVRAIVARATRPARTERYASASALADDIRRHLTHHAVEAREGGLVYQSAKFGRRHVVACASLIAVVATSIAAAVVSGGLAVERDRQRRVAEFQSYVANMAAAGAALRGNDVAAARHHLEQAPAEYREWEWRHLRGRLDSSVRTLRRPDSVEHGALSADGRTVAAGQAVWDARTGHERFTRTPPSNSISLAFSPDGSRVAYGTTRGEIEFLDAKSGAMLRRWNAHAGKVWALAFDAGGSRFASSGFDGRIRFWSSEGEPLRAVSTEGTNAYAIAFDPRRGGLWWGGGDGRVRFVDGETGDEAASYAMHDGNVEGLAISPDGTRIATGSMDRTIKLSDARTGRLQWTREGHDSGVKAVAFAPDGITLASASVDRTVRIWRARDGRRLARLRGHTDLVRSVAYTPDGRSVVSFSRDGCVKFWDAQQTDEVATLRGHETEVLSLAFAPGGGTLASFSHGGGVRIWDAATRTAIRAFPARHSVSDFGALFDFAGQRLFSVDRGLIGTSALQKGGLLKRIEAATPVYSIELFPDGRPLLFGGIGSVSECDWKTGRVANRRAVGVGPIRRIRLDPSGKTLACCDDSDAWLLRVGSNAAPIAVRGAGGWRACIAFRRDGRRVAIAGSGGVRIVETTTGSIARILPLATHVRDVCYSPDGKRLATAANDGTVRIWDPDRGAVVLVLHGHQEYATALAWSDDGTRLASGGGNSGPEACLIRIWEAR